VNNENTKKEVRIMVRLEHPIEGTEIAKKTDKSIVDAKETERLRKFNEELRSRKAPQPKAK
jgi:hypothetical protein